MDTKISHTPGPWSVYQDEKWGTIVVANEAEGRPVIASQLGGEREYLANARLIAAAPELLRQLKRALDVIEAIKDEDAEKNENVEFWTAKDGWGKQTIEGGYAAIAKAEGR